MATKINANRRKLSRHCLNPLDFKTFMALDQHYIRFISTMCIILLIIWLPYAICNIMILFGYVPNVLVLSGVAVFAKLSTLANPLANCYVYKTFRRRLAGSFNRGKHEKEELAPTKIVRETKI